MRYKVVKTDVIDPAIDSKEWEKAETGKVEVNRWSGFYDVPETIFKVLRGPEGFSVYMNTKEENLRSECKVPNGRVCDDSCMEFFFKPDPFDTRYMNFELNPGGTLHLGFGDTRTSVKIYEDRAVFNIESKPVEGNWELKSYIPDEFLLRYYKNIGKVCRGNFYKCGELTGHSHFGAWNEVEVDTPNFHVPDFFGILEIEF